MRHLLIEAPAQESSSRRVRLTTPLLVGAGGFAAAAALAIRDPHQPGSWGFCPWLAATGTFCPGCGGLRAINDLLQLRVLDALGSNLFAVIFVLAVTVGWFAWVRSSWAGRSLRLNVSRRVWVGAAVALAVFSVVRNLPFGAFLAP